MNTVIDDKLLKIIALAKSGVGGERKNAIKLVKKICAKQGLDYDFVMAETEMYDYELRLFTRGEWEETIVGQVCLRFAVTEMAPNLHYNRRAKTFFYRTTPGRHVETINAAGIYLHAFRKECKKLMQDVVGGFCGKHRLYSTLAKNMDSEPLTIERIEAARRRQVMMGAMDEVHIHKQIGSKS